MKNWNKFVAGVSALAIAAAMMTTVSAVSIPEVPNSAFSYELRAEAVSDTQIKVSFQVTNNPGTQALSVSLQFEGDCEPYGMKTNIELEECQHVAAYNAESNMLNYTVLIVPTDSIHNAQETFENFSIDFLFNVDASTTTSCRFSAAVFKYNSLTEGIQYDKALVNGGYGSDTMVETHPYTLGDVDNDGRIKVEDACDIHSIVSVYNAVYGNDSASVASVNYNVEHNITSTTMVGENSIPWATRFSYLMRSGHSYAESADVDQNGYIQRKDGDAILQYYADRAAALPVETLIGTTQVKTVTITL